MLDGQVQAFRDGRYWRIGTAREVDWIVNRTTDGPSITTAIPPVFEAYATFYEPDGVAIIAHERAVVNRLDQLTPDQPWWLGYLETGAYRRPYAWGRCPSRPVLSRRSVMAGLRPLGRHLDMHRRAKQVDRRPREGPAHQGTSRWH
jgi:hypothetical protein